MWTATNDLFLWEIVCIVGVIHGVFYVEIYAKAENAFIKHITWIAWVLNDLFTVVESILSFALQAGNSSWNFFENVC